MSEVIQWQQSAKDTKVFSMTQESTIIQYSKIPFLIFNVSWFKFQNFSVKLMRCIFQMNLLQSFNAMSRDDEIQKSHTWDHLQASYQYSANKAVRPDTSNPNHEF